MPKLNWKTFSPAQKTALITIGTMQVGLFAAAWTHSSLWRSEAVKPCGEGPVREHARATGLFYLGPQDRSLDRSPEADVLEQTGRVT